MSKGRLLVIEGLDGSGKATQAKLLAAHLAESGRRVMEITFPDYESDSSALVKMYLSGRFGEKPDDVNPYAASSFYAVDRYASYKTKWGSFYEAGGIVIADRYTTSNAVHQCSKLPPEQWNDFLRWAFDYEYRLLGLPAPDAVVYLQVDPAVSQKLMTGRYHGDESKKDLHEADFQYLLSCREAALYAAGSTDARIDSLDVDTTADKLSLFFHEHVSHPAPYYYALPDGTPKQFAFCPIREYGECRRAESFGKLLDMYYTVRDQKDAMRQKGQAVRKTVQNLCSRLTKKLAIQEKELEATYDRERLRQLGDILTANLHRIVKGQTTVQCEDFYDEEMRPVDIPISPILSPNQNAAKYYKDYARMKNAEKELTKQLELGRLELDYLKSVLEELNRAGTEGELEEIRRELQEGGYLRPDTDRKRMKQAKLPPMRFESTDGYPIYVGRNNRQNDELTFRLARKDDIWCHASKVHGSHVIISCGGTTPPDDTVTQAAQLAAYYAETGGGQNIPVDVTAVKQVKKIPNGKPGMVIYHTYRTVIANPYPDIVVDALNAETKE